MFWIILDFVILTLKILFLVSLVWLIMTIVLCMVALPQHLAKLTKDIVVQRLVLSFILVELSRHIIYNIYSRLRSQKDRKVVFRKRINLNPLLPSCDDLTDSNYISHDLSLHTTYSFFSSVWTQIFRKNNKHFVGYSKFKISKIKKSNFSIVMINIRQNPTQNFKSSQTK